MIMRNKMIIYKYLWGTEIGQESPNFRYHRNEEFGWHLTKKYLFSLDHYRKANEVFFFKLFIISLFKSKEPHDTVQYTIEIKNK